MIDLAKEFRLAEGAVGKTYEIIRLEGSGAVRRRIMDMGLVPKTRVKLVNVHL